MVKTKHAVPGELPEHHSLFCFFCVAASAKSEIKKVNKVASIGRKSVVILADYSCHPFKNQMCN